MALIERRSAHRFRMKLPLTVHWTSGSAVGQASTESREVSSRGLSFSLPKEIEVGSLVEIVMTLPHEITLAGPIKVRCLGRIMRVEAQKPGKVAVAAAVERYEFLRRDDTAA